MSRRHSHGESKRKDNASVRSSKDERSSLATLGSRALDMGSEAERRAKERDLFSGSSLLARTDSLNVDASKTFRPEKTTNTFTGNFLADLGRRAMMESLNEGASTSNAIRGIRPTPMSQKHAPFVDKANYTIKDERGQWSRVGKMEAFLEKPITREEIQRLESKYDVAIRHSKMTSLAAPTRDVNPSLEREFVNMRQHVLTMYENDEECMPDQQAQLTEATMAQKFTDLIFNEIADSIGIGCIENGRLLRKLRKHYGHAFQLVQNVHRDTLRALQESTRLVNELRHQIGDLKKTIDDAESDFQKRSERAVAEIREKKDEELDDVRSELGDAREQNDSLKYTLSTLNGIFKTMRQDNDSVREANLREANTRMQAVIATQRTKLERLAKLEIENESARLLMKQQSADIEELRALVDEKTNELEKQRSLSQELLASQGEKLAKMEQMMSKVESGGENPEEAQKSLEKMARESIEPQAKDDQVLCVRCRKSMAEARRLDEFENTLGEKMKRLPCASFRILLPNLLGFQPERKSEWVLRCIRSVLMAKLKEDALRTRRGQKRARMPEFLYTWFAPRRDGNYANKRSYDEAVAEADEHRWGLYYGVKALRKRLPEVQLFFELLDETHGEDDCTFYLYNLQILHGIAKRELNWSSYVTDASDYADMQRLVDEENERCLRNNRRRQRRLRLAEKNGATKNATSSSKEMTDEDALPKVPEVQWISQESAVFLIEQTMAKSTEAERDKIILRVLQKCMPAQGRLRGCSGDDFDSGDEDMESDERRAIDSAIVLALLMDEYREEQANRKASVRLMFKTAIEKSEAEAIARANGASRQDDEDMEQSNTLDIQQFTVMIRTLNSDTSLAEIACLYRDTFENGASSGVSVDSFFKCAERVQFFSGSLRLPPFYGSASTPLEDDVLVEETGQEDEKSEEEETTTSLPVTRSQADALRDVVYKHYCLFREVLEEFKDRFGPVQSRALQRLQSQFMNETRLTSGKGMSGVDGRRLWCAYRRILNFLSERRMEILEDTGEKGGPFVSKRVDLEIEQVEAMLSAFLKRKALIPSEQLKKIVRRISAGRICERWRERQRSHPLTLRMRRLMSNDYVRQVGALENVSRQRRLVRREQWMVITVYDIINELYARFASSVAKEMASRRTRDDVDGENVLSTLREWYEPPDLRQFVLNYFLTRYGSVALGELHLHDLFSTMRSRIAGSDANGVVKVFFELLTEGQISQTPEYAENHTLIFFLCAVATCCPTSNVRVLGDSTSSTNTATTPLLPEYNAKTRKALVFTEFARAAILRLFPDRTARETIMQKFDALAEKKGRSSDVLDFNRVLKLMMTSYISEIRRRSTSIRVTLQGLDRTGKNDVRTYMSSYHAFANAMHSSGLLKNRSDMFKVALYRAAIRVATNDCGSFVKVSSAAAANALVAAFRRRGLVGWTFGVRLIDARKPAHISAQLLRFAWLQYAESVRHMILKLDAIASSASLRRTVSTIRDLFFQMKEDSVPKLPIKMTAPSEDKSEKMNRVEFVRCEWDKFCELMEQTRCALDMSGLCRFVPDNHAIELAGGYDAFFQNIDMRK